MDLEVWLHALIYEHGCIIKRVDPADVSVEVSIPLPAIGIHDANGQRLSIAPTLSQAVRVIHEQALRSWMHT